MLAVARHRNDLPLRGLCWCAQLHSRPQTERQAAQAEGTDNHPGHRPRRRPPLIKHQRDRRACQHDTQPSTCSEHDRDGRRVAPRVTLEQSRGHSTPALAKDSAPSAPAATRHNVCHHSAALNPEASSASVVVTTPKANRCAGGMHRASSMGLAVRPVLVLCIPQEAKYRREQRNREVRGCAP